MAKRLIKRFTDGSQLIFDKGNFDDWCIFHEVPSSSRYAIKDIDIFDQLESLTRIFGYPMLYLDFIKIYEKVSMQIENEVLNLISQLSTKYDSKKDSFDYIMTFLYAGMIAEENKISAILKKRIKRLGIHQLLVEERPSAYAANFSRKKPHGELDLECKIRGF